MVGAPVAHNGVDVAKSVGSVQSGDKPSGRPAGIRAFGNGFMNLPGQLDTVPFRDLQDRSETFDHVYPGHGHGHTASSCECGTETTPAEVLSHGGAPQCCLQAGFNLLFGNLPKRLYGWLAVALLFPGTVESGGSGIAEVDKTFGGRTAETFAGDAFYGLGTPVGPHVAEDLSGVGQQVTE